jgi:hypothetical protein
MGKKHTAKCELCEAETHFDTYKRDWPAGWSQTGRSRWGKKYNKQRGYGWWCPKCIMIIGVSFTHLRTSLISLPPGLRECILAHLPGLSTDSGD